MGPSAIQVVDLEGEGRIISNSEALQSILLQPEIKNKPVCVVSITGTFRQGKSFLLNFLVRYLTLKYKARKPISKKWLDSADGKISGFSWKSGSERHTTGILMWSQIFLAELPSGEEVVIVLLDTQGTFDNLTTKQHCAGIFAISTLISSAQIFNLKDKINQFDLEHLEVGYGQLIKKQDPKFRGAPFQNLCFLIRDWQYPFQKDFGEEGGREFLEEIFNLRDQPLEIKTQIENIRSLFENITCFLMPHPGHKVATEANFQGDLEDVSDSFLKHVEEFVTGILAPEKLAPKKINGKVIKASDLCYFIQDYCEQFTNQATPQLKSMFMVTAETNIKIAVEEAESIYKGTMDTIVARPEALKDDELLRMHLQEKSKAVTHFCDAKSFGGGQLKLNYMETLAESLDETFHDYKKLNSAKREKELELSRQEQRHQGLRLVQKGQLEKEYEDKKAFLETEIQRCKQELVIYRDGAEAPSTAMPEYLQSRIVSLKTASPPKDPEEELSLLEFIWQQLRKLLRRRKDPASSMESDKNKRTQQCAVASNTEGNIAQIYKKY